VEINTKAIAYGFVALALAIFGFTVYNIFFILSVIAMTLALYGANSIVAEGELKQLWNVLIVSLFALIFSNLFFSFFQQFIAFAISSFSFLVLIKYFLIKNHDSSWFGALCIELLSFLFLFIIELVLTVMQLVFFSDVLLLP
jgi:hypothetical protein